MPDGQCLFVFFNADTPAFLVDHHTMPVRWRLICSWTEAWVFKVTQAPASTAWGPAAAGSSALTSVPGSPEISQL